ncbi:MAG: ABC transporter ATP-binding protein, partial [Clostridia bacterium]|nr:ABC transporter ATP-binding protein [Clostridia bacterium]
MKKLLRYMGAYKLESVLGPLFKLLEATFELIVPLVVASIIDVGIEQQNRPHIWKMCLILIALAMIGLICSITAQYFAAKASVGFATKLRHILFAHVQTLSNTDMDRLGAPTLIARMTNDINQVQSGVNLALRLLLRSPFVVFGAMIMAFTVDVRSAWTFAVIIPILCVVVFGIMLISIPLYRRVQASLDRVLGITRENLVGVRVLRAFGKQKSETAEFDSRNEHLTAAQKHVGRITALMNPVTFLLINLAVIALIYTGALQVQSGVLTQGEVVALYSYMSQILVELIKMASLIISMTKAAACGSRIQKILEVKPSQIFSTTPVTPLKNADAITFSHVGLTYEGAGEASLHDISFSAAPGETVGIIGGTGAGKSSLISLIPRFYDATEGEIRIAGIPVNDYPAEQLRTAVGIVPQKAVLFRGTVRDNMRWGKRDATDEEIRRALEISQAAEFIDGLESGLDHVIEQGGRNLSGGQRQRLTIARALVANPDILILDDSASALDYATDLKLRRAIAAMDPAPTTVIVSQRAASIRHADRILVL